jgi:hypothetical protein
VENDKTLFNITIILKQTSMKKKEYERPTMQVVELKQQLALLAGSAASGGMTPNDPYTPGGDPLNP